MNHPFALSSDTDQLLMFLTFCTFPFSLVRNNIKYQGIFAEDKDCSRMTASTKSKASLQSRLLLSSCNLSADGNEKIVPWYIGAASAAFACYLSFSPAYRPSAFSKGEVILARVKASSITIPPYKIFVIKDIRLCPRTNHPVFVCNGYLKNVQERCFKHCPFSGVETVQVEDVRGFFTKFTFCEGDHMLMFPSFEQLPLDLLLAK